MPVPTTATDSARRLRASAGPAAAELAAAVSGGTARQIPNEPISGTSCAGTAKNADAGTAKAGPGLGARARSVNINTNVNTTDNISTSCVINKSAAGTAKIPRTAPAPASDTNASDNSNNPPDNAPPGGPPGFDASASASPGFVGIFNHGGTGGGGGVGSGGVGIGIGIGMTGVGHPTNNTTKKPKQKQPKLSLSAASPSFTPGVGRSGGIFSAGGSGAGSRSGGINVGSGTPAGIGSVAGWAGRSGAGGRSGQDTDGWVGKSINVYHGYGSRAPASDEKSGGVGRVGGSGAPASDGGLLLKDEPEPEPEPLLESEPRKKSRSESLYRLFEGHGSSNNNLYDHTTNNPNPNNQKKTLEGAVDRQGRVWAVDPAGAGTPTASVRTTGRSAARTVTVRPPSVPSSSSLSRALLAAAKKNKNIMSAAAGTTSTVTATNISISIAAGAKSDANKSNTNNKSSPGTPAPFKSTGNKSTPTTKSTDNNKKPVVLTPYHLPATTATATTASASSLARAAGSRAGPSPHHGGGAGGARRRTTAAVTSGQVALSYTPTARPGASAGTPGAEAGGVGTDDVYGDMHGATTSININMYGGALDLSPGLMRMRRASAGSNLGQGLGQGPGQSQQWSLLGQQKKREERERQHRERQHRERQQQQRSRGGGTPAVGVGATTGQQNRNGSGRKYRPGFALVADPEGLHRRILASRSVGGVGGNGGRSAGRAAQNSGGRNVSGTGTGGGRNDNANGSSSNNNNADASAVGAEANRHKYKTELCSNYMSTGRCRFGESCKFAHGTDDLRHLTVRTLLANGVTDAACHCVRPCFVHIATGHCPFGVRCTGLHDPRVDDVTDRVLRAARDHGTMADQQLMGMGMMGTALVDGDDEFYDAAEEVELQVAPGSNGWDMARSRAVAQAAANDGGGFHSTGAGMGQIGSAGNHSATPGSLLGRVLQLGSAAGIDLARADDPDRHWLDHYEHPVPGIATDLIVAHLHNHFVNGVNYNNPFGAVLGPVVDTVASKLRRPGDGTRDLHANYLDSVWTEFFDAVVAGKDLTTIKLITEDEVIMHELTGGIRKDRGDFDSPTSIAALHAEVFSSGMENEKSPPHMHRKGSVNGNKYDCEPCGIDLTELERLKIVLKMCYTPKASWHKYSTTHTVLGQEAMIVQSRIFVLSGDGSVEEYLGTAAALDAGHYKPKGDVVRVYEIAYGSDASAKAKAPTALYFDIPMDCIARKNSMNPGRSSTVTMESYIEAARTKPFYIARPYDEDALALVVGILQLRIRELELPGRLDRIRYGGLLDRLVVDVDNAEFEEAQTLYAAKMGLGSQFRCLVSHYATIYWDRCAERADKTGSLDQPVLNVERNYTTEPHDEGTSGAIADTLWDTFVTESERLFQGDPRGVGRSSKVFAYTPGSEGPIPILKKTEDGTPWYEETSNATRCWRDVLLSYDGEGEWEYARQAVLGYKEQNPTARPDSRASARSTRYGSSPAYGLSDQSQSMMSSSYRVGTPYCAEPLRAASSGMGSYSMYSSNNHSRRPSFSDNYGSTAAKRNSKMFSGTPMTRNASFAATPDSYAARARAYAGSTPSHAYAYDFRRSPPVQQGYYYDPNDNAYYN